MRVIFNVSIENKTAIEDILQQCGQNCCTVEKENLSGDQIIAIVAIVAPIVWELIKKYIPDKSITIEAQFDNNTTVIISDRSYERAMLKYSRIKEEYEKQCAKVNSKNNIQI